MTRAERSADRTAVPAMPDAMVGDVVAGQLVALAPGVRRLTAPNPGMMTGPGTNCYLVGTDTVTVIDPGPDDAGHIDALVAAGGGRIGTIALTHTHIDHWPAAPTLAVRTGAEVVAFDSRDGLTVDRSLADGDEVGEGDARVRAVHTPGHASNHICFWHEPTRMLFTGDHVMSGSTVVIAPPDGDMGAYLEALRRVLALHATALAPAHGPLLTDPDAYVGGYISHRLAREASVVEALAAAGPVGADTEALVKAIYVDVHELLHPVARFSVWAHLRKLAAEGRARGVDVDDPDTTWVTGDTRQQRLRGLSS
ncbi:MBL fold metallo-hydrolase [Iamia sp.]|uniref:MBL fold metallo-hydrolase n=1 Tax=Iamia sp. TaxID=2722710 RepID=UPI002BBB5A95|nr:MBL fold metallo-hydrolase [Iamia sp.]HXH55665.1 MBL fold metallo-hydrolase [Iamia sp.]